MVTVRFLIILGASLIATATAQSQTGAGAITRTAPNDTRAAFLRLIDRPRVALEPAVQRLPDRDGLVQEHFTLAAESGERIPGLLLKQASAKGRRPVIIVLHGTGEN